MIDFAKIKIKAGDGGRGAGSFEHVKGKRRGKADGGDGGQGGNVYIVVSDGLNTLEPFRFVKDYKAGDGEQGFSKRRKGALGQDLEIKVPKGTQVRIFQNTRNTLIDQTGQNDNTKVKETYDLVELGQKVLVARGGEGGRGNAHLRDELGRRPFSGEMGKEGEAQQLKLELKLIADVGLIGLPNAGKSTIISALTAARPKIAPYPFTTLEPNLGVMTIDYGLRTTVRKNAEAVGQSAVDKPKLIFADIPGLIEGASEGKGLGDLFLRHIERTKILVHVVDATAPDVLAAYNSVRNEIKAYSKELAKKKEIVVLNKQDLIEDDEILEKLAIFSKKRKKAIVISAKDKSGLELLVSEILKRL